MTQDSSLSGLWLGRAEAENFLRHECPWEWPKLGFAQGMVAHLALKLYLETDRVAHHMFFAIRSRSC
ncbi:MAG: hypothetical protein R2865_11500 [Deinococcales bacterium]